MTQTLAIITIIVCCFGLIITGRQVYFFSFSRKDQQFGRRMLHLFISDFLIYAVTLGFGVSVEYSEAHIAVMRILRIIVLIMNIVACTRLYRHYKNMVSHGQS